MYSVEIRRNPFGESVVVVSGDENLYDSQISTEGEVIASFLKNGASVQVVTPKTPLLRLEEPSKNVGTSTVYDKIFPFGVDERFRVNQFSLAGLELLIEAFISRTEELQSKSENKDSLRHFHPYLVYTISDSSLVGRLLASKEIPPPIQEIVNSSREYFKWKSDRCMHCDIIAGEKGRYYKKKPNVLFLYEGINGAIAFRPYTRKDQHTIGIYPLEHIPRLTGIGKEIREEQTESLASVLYESLGRIGDDIKNRDIPTVNVTFYSAPLCTKELGQNKINDFYHLYLEISPVDIPERGNSYKIPGSWTVVPKK